jgi:uncharacterized membrane protein
MNLILFESGSSGIGAVGGVGLVAGVVFFLVLAGVAYVAFRMLKRTVKLAIRMAIVGIILLVAAVGTVLIWWSGAAVSKPARPPATRTR